LLVRMPCVLGMITAMVRAVSQATRATSLVP
jgi:hypothetical protein